MIVLWLEILDVFFWYFLLINTVTSGVTACNVDAFKKTWDNTWISFPHHRNLKHQSSFLVSLKVELMLLLAVLNRLKSFRWYFLLFAICRIIWPSTGKSLYYIITQQFSTTCKHHHKIINQGMENLWHICHVHSKLTGLRRLHLGIDSLVCIVN